MRYDFEYLKYDFRLFTVEMSKWQIDVDERFSKIEEQIQGIQFSLFIEVIIAVII